MITKKYLKEKEVSELTGFSLSTLRNQRSQGIGIPYIKTSERMVRYSIDDVLEYMESRKIDTGR